MYLTVRIRPFASKKIHVKAKGPTLAGGARLLVAAFYMYA